MPLRAARRSSLIALMALLALVASFALATLAPSAAQAGFRINAFDGEVVDVNGDPASQAGSHPFSASTWIDLGDVVSDPILGVPVPDDQMRNITVDLPPGFIGNPQVVSNCTRVQLLTGANNGGQCPLDTQVGLVRLTAPTGNVWAALYQVEPPGDSPAAFAFNFNGTPVFITASVRSDSDYGLTLHARNINQAAPIMGVGVTLWGVPGSPVNDQYRFGYQGNMLRACLDTGAVSDTPVSQRSDCMVDRPARAFLTNPTACTPDGVGLKTSLTATSWRGVTDRADFFTHVPPKYPLPPDQWGPQLGPTGCAQVPFDPTMTVRPTSSQAGAPTGLEVDLSIPQESITSPAAIASGHLKTAQVVLPEGMVVNPSGANGLDACLPDQIGLRSTNAASCPQASDIGDVSIETPVLAEAMRGDIFLAKQSQNPFGTLLAVYIVAEGSGVTVKLAGKIEPDPTTGRVTATFDDNPQLPFSSLKLRFKGGERAPLSNPTTCGTQTTTSTLTSWSGKTATSTSSFVLSGDGAGAPCPPRGFAPAFSAAMADPVGGKSSTFSLTFSRSDNDQELRDITVALPEGLTGVIASADLCADAQAAAGSCGAGSLVGSTTTGAGAGTNPYYLPGQVYITGPYKGAPFGLSIVVPAVAGPFNLGTVVVRAAIFVDRNNASLRVASDPLPRILQGVPLAIRTVTVRMDKPGFMLNPTSCAQKSIAAQIGSNNGALASVGSRFQVGDCGALPYKPNMTLKVGARGKLTRGKRTPLNVTLAMPKGNANNRSVQVTLPKALNARLDVVNRTRACSIDQFRAERCPLVVGNGTAVTPLLRDPLKGSAYFVYNPARRLPDLVVRLKGQVDIDLVGKVTITRDLRLQTTFDLVPDVPITTFSLNLESGSTNGPVGTTRNLCLAETRRALAASLIFRGHNGRAIRQSKRIGVQGCANARARRTAKKPTKRTSRRGSAKSKK